MVKTTIRNVKAQGILPGQNRPSSTLNRSSMKSNLYIYLFFLAFFINQGIGNAQEIDFTLRYNTTDNQYEVYGKPNFTDLGFFVGGGSQLSIVLPASIPDNSLIISTVAGGIWTDNSKIYAPSATPNVDYHGIASNGSMMSWTFGQENLLFTFSIPNETCLDGIRLFENAEDPSSAEPSMNGADFQNYFANAFTFADSYRANYNNKGTSCGPPSIIINNINTIVNTSGQSCGSIIDINPDATYTASVCKAANNGTATVTINNATNQLCVDFMPTTDYTGQDSVCVEICDENDVCVEAMVLINVIGNTPVTPTNNCTNQVPPNVTFNTPICKGDSIILKTAAFDSTYTYEWTNANGLAIGNQPTLTISSNSSLAVSPYRITRTQVGCTPVTSLSIPIEIIDFSLLSVENNGPACAESAVALGATGLNVGTFNWYLAGTNTLVATGVNPTIQNISTTTTYRLEVSHNGCSNPNVLETTVIVDPKPNFGDIPRSITVCRGEDVLITPTNDPATGEEIRYIWKGPNDFLYKNNTTEDEFPLFLENITPEQAGSYSIDLTSKNGCEVDSRSIIINVLDDLTAPKLTATNEVVCRGDAIEITATQQNDAGIEFQWYTQNNNGDLSLLQTTLQPTLLIENVNSSNSGKYLVRTTKNGCISGFSNTITITVFDISSSVEISNNGPVCQGESVQLSAKAITGATYNWYQVGSNELIAAGQTITVSNINATTTFELEITLADCSNTSRTQTTVIVDTKPNLVDLPSTINICRGENLQVTPRNNQARSEEIQYTWRGPNDFIFQSSTTQDEFPLSIENILSEQSGSYSLELTTQSGCVLDAQFISINVADDLSAPQLSTTNELICSGDVIEITATQQDDPSTEFEWFIQGENDDLTLLQTTQQPTLLIENVSNINSGKYLVRTTKNNCISGFSNTITITVFDMASTVEVANNGPICQGQSVQLSASAIPNASYNWYMAGSDELIAAGQTITISDINTTTNYEVAVTLANCSNISRTATTVVVAPKPSIKNISKTATYCVGSEVVLSAFNSPAQGQEVVFTWTGPNNFNFTGMTTTDSFELVIPNITIEKSGTYTLELSSSAGCETDARSVIVNVDNELTAPQLIPLQRVVCGGNPIELTASVQNDAAVQFEWYLQNDEEDLFLLEITNVPSIIIDNPTSASSGKYLVRVKRDDCISGFSNTEIITVLDETSNLSTNNSTSITQPTCEGGFVQLSVPFYEGANYQWFGPAGFTSDKYNPFISPVSPINAGEYFAVISVDGCAGVVTEPTTVYVNTMVNVTPTIIGNSLICEGETLILELTGNTTASNDEPATIIWYNSITNEVLDTTFNGSLRMPNIRSQNSGTYHATIYNNGCESPVSNSIEVTVASRSELVAYAGKDAKLCTAGAITLEALPVENTMGTWTSPTGSVIENTTTSTTKASNLKAGENLFIWTIQDVCGQTAFDTLFVIVLQTTGDIVNAGVDQNICESGSISLNANALEESTGLWTQNIDQANQGVVIQNPNDPNTQVDGMLPGNVYQFDWTLSTVSCPDFATDNVVITVNEEPEEIAFITAENSSLTLCDGNQKAIIAETPLFSTGKWTTTGGAQIANPTLPETMAGDIPAGDNLFIWTLSNEACTDFSADTITIYREEEIAANADQYELSFNDSITFDVLENDILYKRENLTFRITKFPDNGLLKEEEDGSITYVPIRNYFGEDNFRYKLCSNFCEEVCDTAIVNITIAGSDDASPLGCFIPNVLSPNDDDINDQFLIGCLSENPDASIKVFNRWGDEVYQAAPYQNDWEGTHNGRPLPAGTYYYTLRLTPTSDPIQDFITIFR